MPTRSGLDFHEINPSFFVCAYCYQAYPSIKGIVRHEGMISKREMVCVDDEWVALHGRYTRVWTEPHCFTCNRQVKGWPVHYKRVERYKYF